MNKRTNNPSPEFDREKELKVILEDMNSKFDLLAEAQSSMSSDIQSLKSGQTGIITRLDRIEIKVDGLDVRVGRLEVKVNRLEMKTDVMYKELSGQRTDIIEIKDFLKRQDNRLTKLELNTDRA